MSTFPDNDRDLTLLEQIAQNPDSTQASLAVQLGVAVGTINWHLKRLIEKGYVKVRRIERHKLRYIITPEGMALRARLTVDYIQNSFRLYRDIRERTRKATQKIRDAGYSTVRILGEGDVADVVRLTCLEQGLTIVPDGNAPALRVVELKIHLEWEGSTTHA